MLMLKSIHYEPEMIFHWYSDYCPQYATGKSSRGSRIAPFAFDSFRSFQQIGWRRILSSLKDGSTYFTTARLTTVGYGDITR